MPFGERLGQIGQGVLGLLGDEGGALTNLQQNPAFQMGVGLLDPRQSISQGILGGLKTAREAQITDEDRERMQKLREQLSELIAKQMGGGTGLPAPTPTEQALQQSLIPGQPGSSLNVPGATPPIMPQAGAGSETERLLQQLGWLGTLQR